MGRTRHVIGLSGIRAAIIVFLTIGAFGSTICRAEDIPQVNWRCQLCVGGPEKIYGGEVFSSRGLCKLLVDKVRERTNGKFDIKMFPAGAIIKAMETPSGLARGAVEMGLTVASQYTGMIPEGDFTTSFPFGPADSKTFWKLITETDFLKIMREAYAKHNLYYLTRLSAGDESFTTISPVHRMSDLKGRKIRTGGIIGDICKAWDAVPVNIAITEVYTALQRGTIDGYTATNYIGNAYKLFEVAKYVSLPILFTSGPEITVNLQALEKLPPKFKEILIEEGYKLTDYAHNVNAVKLDRLTRSVAEKQYGVTYTTIPPEDYAKMKKLAMPYWEKLAKKSEACSKLIKIWEKYGQ
jgi:TRAP-type C4-dicarboxylate transport system substrate-binding protein